MHFAKKLAVENHALEGIFTIVAALAVLDYALTGEQDGVISL